VLEGVEVAPPLLSPGPEAVWDEGRPGQARPLASVSPLCSCEALGVTAPPAQRG